MALGLEINGEKSEEETFIYKVSSRDALVWCGLGVENFLLTSSSRIPANAVIGVT